jgi:serine/threonine protein kinase
MLGRHPGKRVFYLQKYPTGDFGSEQVPQTRPCPRCGLGVSSTQQICPQDGTLIFPAASPNSLLDGKYEFIEMIGSGGMGVVYKARQKLLNRLVAIKMLHTHLMTDRALVRFQQEGRAGSQLSHKNIVQVHDFGISEHGQPYLVMDFVEGQTLANKIASDGVMQTDYALWVFTEICDGLAHAHERGVLHRDLKPANILITSDGKLKILDFGIAKIAEPDGSPQAQITKTGEMMGSPSYMSPEQGLGKPMDQRSDLYSMGCLMFECLTCSPPFAGATVIATIMHHVNDRPPTVKEAFFGANTPDALDTIIDKLLKKDPGERYQSATELQKALLDVKANQREPSPAMPVKSAPAVQPRKPANNVLLALALCVLFIAAGIGGAAVMLNKKPSESHNPPPNTSPPPAGQTDGSALTTDDRDLRKYIRSNPSEVEYKFGQMDITDAGLAPLADATACTNLDLHNTSIKGWGLKYIENLRLIDLRLDTTDITDDALASIGKIKTLEALNIKNDPNLTGSGLKYLEGMNLVYLDLEDTAISCDSLKYLTKINQCVELRLSMVKDLRDECMSTIAQVPRLASLSLNGTKITADGIRRLVPAKELRDLSLINAGITDDAARYFVQMPNLLRLNVVDTKMTDKGLQDLAASKSLKLVYASGFALKTFEHLKAHGIVIQQKMEENRNEKNARFLN